MAKTAASAAGAHSRNMMTALIGYGYPAIISFFTGPILAHALGVDGRGAVAAAAAPLALVTTIATFGIPEAVTYAVARTPALARAAAARGMAILALSGALAVVAVVLAAPFLSGGDDEVRSLIYIACIAVIPSLFVGILRGVASAHQRWRLVTSERIVSSTLRLVVLIPFWITDTLSPLIATIALAAMPVMGGLVYLGVVRRRDEPLPQLNREARMAGLAGYGSRIWVGSLSGILLSRLDQTLMTPLSGTYELGLYVVAVTISELPLIIHLAIRDVTFVSEAASSADDRLAASARISTLASGASAMFVGITMIWWLPLLFGEGFRPALPVAAILLAALFLSTPGSIAGSGLSARGRPGLRSWSLLIAFSVNIILLVLLAPPFGAIGAAIATLLGNVIASNLNLLFLRTVFGIPPLQFYGVKRSDLQVLKRFAQRITSAVLRRR